MMIIIIIRREDHSAKIQIRALPNSAKRGRKQEEKGASPLRATMFQAVGLNAIDANEKYKEGFERSTWFNKADMVVRAVKGRRRKKRGC